MCTIYRTRVPVASNVSEFVVVTASIKITQCRPCRSWSELTTTTRERITLTTTATIKMTQKRQRSEQRPVFADTTRNTNSSLLPITTTATMITILVENTWAKIPYNLFKILHTFV